MDNYYFWLKGKTMKKHFGLWIFFTAWILLILVPAHAGNSKLLQKVNIDQAVLDVSKKTSVTISWNQSYESTMDAMICNLDGRVVRTLMTKAKGNAGNHQVQWNGLDDKGIMCPNNAYIPIIKIRTRQHGNAIHNPSSSPWGGRVDPLDLQYNKSKQKITYNLKRKALCLIRVGEKDGGPVYKTILNWEPREPGLHEESWDGMDRNGIVNAAKKEKFDILLDAFSLPEGAIMIKGSKTKDYQFNKIKKQFALYPPQEDNLFLHVFHPRDVSHDIAINAALLNPASNTKIPVVKGIASFKVNVDEKEDKKYLKQEKFECYIFVDGKLVYENPQDKLPSILAFDTSKYPNGEYVITINFRTTEDRVGTYSLKVNIKN